MKRNEGQGGIVICDVGMVGVADEKCKALRESVPGNVLRDGR